MEFLAWLENTGFGTWVRESPSIFAYPGILFLHTVGLGFLVGTNIVVDLRLLGFAPEAPLPPLEKFFPVMWAGFWINAFSGTALLIADATTKLANPVFFVKMGCVALALVNMLLIRRKVLRGPGAASGLVPAAGKVLAITSMILWAGAITAGRLMAYLGPVAGAPGLFNR
jgi:hypothetical protein